MPLKTPPVQYDLIRLAGGLDQVTPTLSLPPGVARRAANFECSITGGYTRIAGYERYDGRPSPSAALYLILVCTISGTLAVGDSVAAAPSGASGKVIAVDGTSVVLTRVSVTDFVIGDTLSVGGVAQATVDDIEGIATDGLLDATYKALAADDYRADIQAVPGEGRVLGVALYNGTLYAWRNAVGSASADMYRSSTGGWVQVPLGVELKFDAGKNPGIADGDTVTGQTSGATGVVTRLVLETGTFAGNDAAGRLIFASVTGTFQDNEHLRVGGNHVADADGTQAAITLAPNGRYEAVVGNFGGGTANYRLYGCDGQNRAFEFDGTVFVPIKSGMAVDKPTHIAVHKQHLFLSFGASLQFSALGLPYQWTPLLGAGELAVSAPITNLLVLPGDQSSGALAVYTRNDTNVLYGTDSSSFSLSTFNTGTGAIAYTAQNMDQAYVLDDRGIMSLGTSLNFGNFLPASLTMNIRPFIQQRLTNVKASLVDRIKGQYRVFFGDKTGVYLTVLNGKLLGSMPVQFDHAVLCTAEGEATSGEAVSFFGSDDGFVYQLDRGTSFDGEEIFASLSLVYNAIRSPRILKRYRKASVELTGDSYASIAFGYDLGYRTTALTQPVDVDYSNDLRASYWDDMTWDNFVWDGSDLSPTEVQVEGTAENIAIRIASVSALFQPFTVNSIIVHYTPRRGLR